MCALGKRIWISPSGSNAVVCSVVLSACHGPLSEGEWRLLAHIHCVQGERPYGSRTYAWEISKLKRCVQLIPIKRVKGTVVWQIGPG